MSKVLLFLILFCIVSLSVSAALISYWDFNSNLPASGQNWAKPLYSSYPGSLTYTYPTAVSATGTSSNSIDSEPGKCFHIAITNQDDYNGKYIEITFPTDGYKNLSMSFVYYKIGNAFTTGNVSYSTGSQNYIPIEIISFSSSVWPIYSVDLSGIAEIENKPSVTIRITTTGATASGTRSFRFENIQIKGDPITLPVEFSGMTVNPGTDNNAYITWTTQSETGVNGFHVLRGCSDLLSEAEIISPLIPATNTSTTQTYFFADDDLPNAGLYYYWLQSLDYNGETGYFGPQTLVWSPGDPAGSSAPLKTGLSTLYPNPFNPSLTIAYALNEPAPAQIMIYNLRGQAVHSIDIGRQVAGEHKYVWNGKSDRGEACPSGVYRIILHAGKVIDNRKVLLLK